jgi:hypothetical protein
MDSYTQALHNLESRLAMALDSARQAQDDLNAIRMRAGLGPIQYSICLPRSPSRLKPGPRPAA